MNEIVEKSNKVREKNYPMNIDIDWAVIVPDKCDLPR